MQKNSGAERAHTTHRFGGITVTLSGTTAQLVVDGVLDQRSALDFQSAIDLVLHSTASTAQVNLEQAQAIQSACIGKLVLFANRMKDRRGRVTITRCNTQLEAFLRSLRIDHIVPVDDH